MSEKHQLEVFLEHAPAAMAMFDDEMRYISATRRWISDYDIRAPIIGRSHYDVFPDIPERWKEIHRRALAGETLRSEDDVFERADGTVHRLRWELCPWRREDGSIGGVVVLSEDISERRDMMRRLDATQRRLRAVMEAAPVGISYSDDASCRRITGNRALAKQFEFPRQENFSASAPDPEAAGRQVRFFSGGREIGDAELPLQRAVAETREIAPIELEVLLPSGKRWHTLASAAPILGEQREVIGGVAVTVDITERRKMEEAMREADRRKDEFLAVLAHELRNPLAPLRNALYILRRTVTDASAAALISMMERQLDNLVRLVDDLMEVSRITRGKIELRTEIVSLRDVIDTAVATSAPAMEAKKHDLMVSLDEAAAIVQGDSTRLVQVFANLLNNAAKFTPHNGRIEIDTARVGGEAVVRVRDNGRGVSQEILPRIFELFTQDGPVDQPRDGIGVGLALARGLVELHGGRIDAFSAGSGRGAEFTVRLPLAQSDDAGREAKSQTKGELMTKRILVVDDNPDVADSLAMLLETMGEEAKVVYGGDAALEAVAAFEPHIAFIDIGMPGMDGYETARRIRRLPKGGAVTLVALSGWGREEDRSRAFAAGFERHLVKPVSLDALMECLPPSAGV